jgi:hypothetical protein
MLYPIGQWADMPHMRPWNHCDPAGFPLLKGPAWDRP